MLKYSKIETLFRRDDETHKVLPGQFRRPEFSLIKTWDVTEKIDGTNIRVSWTPPSGEPFSGPYGLVSFGGRTDRAQMPTMLLDYLQHTFAAEVDCFVPISGSPHKPELLRLHLWKQKKMMEQHFPPNL